jgi:hypothetical protein
MRSVCSGESIIKFTALAATFFLSTCYPSISFLVVLPGFPSSPCSRSDGSSVVAVMIVVRLTVVRDGNGFSELAGHSNSAHEPRGMTSHIKKKLLRCRS